MGSKDQNQSKCKLQNSWQPKIGKHQEISKPFVKVMEQHDFMKGVEQHKLTLHQNVSYFTLGFIKFGMNLDIFIMVKLVNLLVNRD